MEISDPHLILRPVTIGDAETLFAWRQEPRMKQFNPLEDISLEQLTASLAKTSSDLSDRAAESYRWMVESQGKVVGSVSFKPASWRMGYGEIGYSIAEAHHGKGLGTATVKLLIEKLFAESDINKLMAYVAARNTASCRILERLKFQREGYLRDHYVVLGKYVDEVLFGLLRRDFETDRSAPSAPRETRLDIQLFQSQLIEYLVDCHGCHTVILYGSFARGDATEASDIDVLGIRSEGEHYRIGKTWNGRLLDAWIYSDSNLPRPEELRHMYDGIVLKEQTDNGTELLEKIRSANAKPVPAMPQWERQQLSTWIEKMTSRAAHGDEEGDYRRHWLLQDLLPLWFSFSGLRFQGSRKAFRWLQHHEPGLYRLFVDALSPSATMEQIRTLAATVRKAANVHRKFIIRPGSLSDVKDIARVHVDTWKSAYRGIIADDFLDGMTYENSEQMCTEVLSSQNPHWHCLVATDEDKVVIGFVTGGKIRTPETGPYEAEIYAIYLRSEFHHIGIGKRLFLESARQLGEEGFKSMMLWVLKDNPARAFYGRMGGTEFATKTEVIGGKEQIEIGIGWTKLPT